MGGATMKLISDNLIELKGWEATYLISAADEYDDYDNYISREDKDALDAFFERVDWFENYATNYSDKGVYWNETLVDIKGTNKYVVIPWEYDARQGERMFPDYNNGLREYTYEIKGEQL
jgi:hypothetical protein